MFRNAARRRLSTILSDSDRETLVSGLSQPAVRSALAHLVQNHSLSDELQSEISSLLNQQARSLQAAGNAVHTSATIDVIEHTDDTADTVSQESVSEALNLTDTQYAGLKTVLGANESHWEEALTNISSAIPLTQLNVDFHDNGTAFLSATGLNLGTLQTNLRSMRGGDSVPVSSLDSVASSLDAIDVNALVHNVTAASLDINGVLRLFDKTETDVNNLVRELEEAYQNDPNMLAEILEGASGQGLDFAKLSYAVKLLESANPMLGLSSLVNNADIKHAMNVLNMTDISALIGSNPLAIFQPNLSGYRRLSEAVHDVKAKAGAVEAVRHLMPEIQNIQNLATPEAQRKLLKDHPMGKSYAVPPTTSRRRLQTLSKTDSAGDQAGDEAAVAEFQITHVTATPVDVNYAGTVSFVETANGTTKYRATTGDLGFSWGFDDAALIPPVVACWEVDGQAASAESWPSVIVQSASFDIIEKESGTVLRSIDLSRPEAENVFEYYTPGWNVTQAWLQKKNAACAWIPMCYLMDQVTMLRNSNLPLSAQLTLTADKVPPTNTEIELTDARVMVRAAAAEGTWTSNIKDDDADTSQLPAGTVLSPPIATITHQFLNSPIFGFQLPKPQDSQGLQSSAGFAVLASAESRGLTFEFNSESWSWLPESAQPAYGRILDQLKTFDDSYQEQPQIADDDEEDYEASAIAMFSAKRDLPIRVNEWTYVPRFVLETIAYGTDKTFVMQKCLPLFALGAAADPLSAAVFEMLYSNGPDVVETAIQVQTFMEAAPIQAMVSSQDGNSVFDLRRTLIDDYSQAEWTINVTLSKIYPGMRAASTMESLDEVVACMTGDCDLFSL
eukprot:Blabericola_migrator_1__6115@NODE_308_length_10078_cov_493_999600_g252_i0_p2_GENE_NODE_308_length_10078_cov_493_999600_g252_i0NODE_308_length_10078_cov_493_999600_g252_i0_p2_ORF_typecomplete_len844_score195_61DUF3313/PF11769_8/0_076_NODE_308_length_10078_cov_493_999600_g252_i073989929